jgi:hypothetical protein
MSDASSARLRGGAELVQPAVIRLYNNLVQVYRTMRERQKEIDAAFDRVAAQIGFVVTTTLPVRLEVAEGGAVKGVSFDGEALRGTIFEKELSGLLQGFTQKPFSGVPAGTYRFYLIWYDALNLKLRFDPFEKVHYLQSLLGSIVSQQGGLHPPARVPVPPEPGEPPHWFDPGVAIAVEEVSVILAIDEVYPELRLAERIQAGRLAISRLRWGGWPPYPNEMVPVSYARRYDPNEMAPLAFGEQLGGREQEFLAKVRAMLGK